MYLTQNKCIGKSVVFTFEQRFWGLRRQIKHQESNLGLAIKRLKRVSHLCFFNPSSHSFTPRQVWDFNNNWHKTGHVALTLYLWSLSHWQLHMLICLWPVDAYVFGHPSCSKQGREGGGTNLTTMLIWICSSSSINLHYPLLRLHLRLLRGLQVMLLESYSLLNIVLGVLAFPITPKHALDCP